MLIFKKNKRRKRWHLRLAQKPNLVQMTTLTGSVPKPSMDKSEDAWLVRDSLLWAVSDGAGGVGIFADRWAKCLLENLPEKPLMDFQGIFDWTDGIWKPFVEDTERIITSNEVGSKFLEEGSLATLAAAWLTDHQGGKATFQAMLYGDSAIFHYDAHTQVLRALPRHLSTYTRSPFLLNWKTEPLADGLQCATFELRAGQYLVLTTDAVAQYLFLSYAVLMPESDWAAQAHELREPNAYHSMYSFFDKIQEAYKDKGGFQEQIWEPFVQALSDEAGFKTWAYNLLEAGLLAYDDYTAVGIAFPNSFT